MAKKEWNSLKGLRWKMGVGVTMTEALNAEDATKLFVTTDHKVVMNGEVMDNVVGTISYMAFYADGETSNDDLIDALTLKLRNGVSVENANGVANVLNLCVEHGLVLKDQDFGMLVGVSSYEDMGLMYYSLTGMGIGQMEKGPGPSLFNLTLAYDKNNATIAVKQHMANMDVSLLKKLSYNNKKKTTKFAPCVHKAIPTYPKAGRRYFSSNGFFSVEIKKNTLSKDNITFTWNDKIGELKAVVLCFQDGGFFKINTDSCKSINAENFNTLFGDTTKRVQLIFTLHECEDRKPCIIEIESDEAMFMGGGFAYKVVKKIHDEEKAGGYGLCEFADMETASPNFRIKYNKVVFTKPALLDLKMGTRAQKGFRGFYKKYDKKRRVFDKETDTFVKRDNSKTGKRWKEVLTKSTSDKYNLDDRIDSEISNAFPVNNQARLFRFYPCYFNGWKRKYRSNDYVEVIYKSKKLSLI